MINLPDIDTFIDLINTQQIEKAAEQLATHLNRYTANDEQDYILYNNLYDLDESLIDPEERTLLIQLTEKQLTKEKIAPLTLTLFFNKLFKTPNNDDLFRTKILTSLYDQHPNNIVWLFLLIKALRKEGTTNNNPSILKNAYALQIHLIHHIQSNSNNLDQNQRITLEEECVNTLAAYIQTLSPEDALPPIDEILSKRFQSNLLRNHLVTLRAFYTVIISEQKKITERAQKQQEQILLQEQKQQEQLQKIAQDYGKSNRETLSNFVVIITLALCGCWFALTPQTLTLFERIELILTLCICLPLSFNLCFWLQSIKNGKNPNQNFLLAFLTCITVFIIVLLRMNL